MDVDTITWLWLICGMVLMLSEIFVPGLVVVFLGLSALLVAAGRWLGFIDGFLDSFTYWFVFSLTSVLGLRGLITKLLPGNVFRRSADEDKEAIGHIVEVIEETSPDHDKGRIRFRGTTWKAKTEFGRIFPGQKARIQGRENMVRIVDPAESENHSQLDSMVDKVEKNLPLKKKKSRRFFKRWSRS